MIKGYITRLRWGANMGHLLRLLGAPHHNSPNSVLSAIWQEEHPAIQAVAEHTTPCIKSLSI